MLRQLLISRPLPLLQRPPTLARQRQAFTRLRITISPTTWPLSPATLHPAAVAMQAVQGRHRPIRPRLCDLASHIPKPHCPISWRCVILVHNIILSGQARSLAQVWEG